MPAPIVTAAERKARKAYGKSVADLYPVRSTDATWEQLDIEFPGLVDWVSAHGDEVIELAQRIQTGCERRVTALRDGDHNAVQAIDARLAELREQIAALDYGARRYGLIRSLMALRATCGPCVISIRSPDGEVSMDVR